MSPEEIYAELKAAHPDHDWDAVAEKVWLGTLRELHPIVAEKTVLFYNAQEGKSLSVAGFLKTMETVEKTVWEDLGYMPIKDPPKINPKHHIEEARHLLERVNEKHIRPSA